MSEPLGPQLGRDTDLGWCGRHSSGGVVANRRARELVHAHAWFIGSVAAPSYRVANEAAVTSVHFGRTSASPIHELEQPRVRGLRWREAKGRWWREGGREGEGGGGEREDTSSCCIFMSGLPGRERGATEWGWGGGALQCRGRWSRERERGGEWRYGWGGG